jgi:2-polyprenyl-6-methoxyphenol hydroxylase-like FAD-dependent oxidoreductase
MQVEVAIVGGGPVGLGLGIELGRRGVKTVVVEKEQSLHRIPKGQNLTQRTMEHFRAWGVDERIRAARVMPKGYPAGGINAYRDLMSDYAHPWFRRDEVSRFYFTDNERLPQYSTEEVLRQRIGELGPVELLLGVAVIRIDHEGDRVLIATDGATIDAAYVIGCDGSHSMVRDQARIAETRMDHDRQMVLLVFRSKELHEILVGRFGESSFFNVLHPDLDGYWRFLGRVDVGESWFFHAPVPAGTTIESLDHRSLLAETVGTVFELELDYVGFWDLRIAIADRYRSGRVFIAGDAAHSHPPYGGYGINTGLEDARNLGWKLAAAIEGWAGDQLLDSYTLERRPVFESTASDFIEAFIENDREFVAKYGSYEGEQRFAEAWDRRRRGSNLGVSVFDPHYEGSPIVFGPAEGETSAVGRHSLQALPGHRLPPPAASDPDALFDSLGDGFTLLSTEGFNDRVRRFESAASDLGIPLTTRRIGEPDAAAYGAAVILVRPDHFVSWIEDASTTPESQVLTRSVGR